MTIETSLYTTLTTDGGVTALINTRVYPNLAPEGVARPYATYHVVSGEHIDTITGVGDMERKRIQISCHADTYSSAKAVANAVIAALEGDGYLSLQYDFYDPTVQVHTCIVDWSFLN